MKKNNGGFTLVELLAVIVILGLLMAIAIPSVTKYITQSRKKTLISSIDSYVTAVSTAVNDNEFGPMSKEDTMYYIPVSNEEDNSCISLEKGGTNPFGNWKEAYVVVNYDATNYSYDYYFTFYDDAGYGMSLTKFEDISATGNIITNPSPVNADNIKTQTNDRATNIEVLSPGTCKANSIGDNVAGGGAGSPEAPKVTTLAGTTWKMNDKISGYSFFDVFDYENQTGWDDFPYGCVATSGSVSYYFWGFSLTEVDGLYLFGTVQSVSVPLALSFAPMNALGVESGWYVSDPMPFLEGTKEMDEIIADYKKGKTEAPTFKFSTTTNGALENTELINWMYENATMV